MYGLILAGVLLIVGVIFILWGRQASYGKRVRITIGLMMILCVGSFILINIRIYIGTKCQIQEYKAKQEYIESQINRDGRSLNETIEDQAIQELKVSCNKWLLEKQTFKQSWGHWLLMPDEIMKLELIQ